MPTSTRNAWPSFRITPRAGGLLGGLLLGACLALSGCVGGGAEPDQPPAGVGDTSVKYAKLTVGDYAGLPDHGNALSAVQHFYSARFGARVPDAPDQQNGLCAPRGPCHLCRDAVPDPNTWERITPDSGKLPTTYDLIVYDAIPGNPLGHVAIVDHVEGKEIYVMDVNYLPMYPNMRADKPHTIGRAPCAWYHLRSVPVPPWGVPGGPRPAAMGMTIAMGNGCPYGDGLYCGGDGVMGDVKTLYYCTGAGKLAVQAVCLNGCQPNPPYLNDQCVGGGCGVCPYGDGLYCGGNPIAGDPDTLYDCEGGCVSVVQTCQAGCHVNPPGVHDNCN